ncbi:MAG: hypothetical protein PF480_14160 [Roseovarius sp.]|jgi:hypothetical protein|nr:hypothetical protein [Roseovarius sp.]
MIKLAIFSLAGWFGLVSVWLLISPAGYYATVPGVAASGPLNPHFARDVGLAFLVSAAALFIGAQRGNRSLAVLGAGFPTLHGVLHLVEWLAHNGQAYHNLFLELSGTVLPGLLAFAAALALSAGKVEVGQ